MSSGEDTGERNPFAPPPADAPEQPWRPRLPQGAQQPPAEDPSQDGPRDSSRDDRPAQVPPNPWSPGHGGGWSAPQQPQQPRFDPNDPVQRRSRFALSAGMAGMFCAVTIIPSLALLLGALALYWALSALRADRHKPAGGPTGWESAQARPQTPAALGGLLTGGVAVLFALSWFGLQFHFQPYTDCVNSSPTQEAVSSCSNLAPNVWVQLNNPDAG